MLCYVMSCYVMSCYVMLCYVRARSVTFFSLLYPILPPGPLLFRKALLSRRQRFFEKHCFRDSTLDPFLFSLPFRWDRELCSVIQKTGKHCLHESSAFREALLSKRQRKKPRKLPNGLLFIGEIILLCNYTVINP